MLATIWKDKLDASPLHGWFEAFEEDAPKALHDLLAGHFDLANLPEAEPRALLSGWVLKDPRGWGLCQTGGRDSRWLDRRALGKG